MRDESESGRTGRGGVGLGLHRQDSRQLTNQRLQSTGLCRISYPQHRRILSIFGRADLQCLAGCDRKKRTPSPAFWVFGQCSSLHSRGSSGGSNRRAVGLRAVAAAAAAAAAALQRFKGCKTLLPRLLQAAELQLRAMPHPEARQGEGLLLPLPAPAAAAAASQPPELLLVHGKKWSSGPMGAPVIRSSHPTHIYCIPASTRRAWKRAEHHPHFSSSRDARCRPAAVPKHVLGACESFEEGSGMRDVREFVVQATHVRLEAI